MKMLRYEGRNVYTPLNREVSERDLATARIETGNIEEAYFYEFGEGSRAYLNKEKAVDGLSCLSIRVKGNNNCIEITGLDKIVDFMIDSKCFGFDLSTLRGKPIEIYNCGADLLGISISLPSNGKGAELPHISVGSWHPVTHRQGHVVNHVQIGMSED
ncbi:MAG: hypothetical protein AABW79_04180 [Nanoarchaeota archaeon]